MLRITPLLRRTVLVTALLATLGCQAPAAPAKSTSSDPLQTGRAVLANELRPTGERVLKARILVHAPPKVVWDMVHEERHHNPDLEYSRIVEQRSPVEAVLEEKFIQLPLIGTATCLIHMTEVPLQRIDYKMTRSDRFKAMDGSWVLTPAENGTSTILELSSHLEMGLAIPHMFLDGVASKKLEKRVMHVRDLSEQQSRLAAGSPHGQS